MQLDQALRSKLRKQRWEDPGDHCGAEVLAAFVEKRLGAAERDRVVRHMSLCRDCRDTLAFVCQGVGKARQVEARPTMLRIACVGAVAALLCVSLGFLYYRSERSSTLGQKPVPVVNDSAKMRVGGEEPRRMETALSQREPGALSIASPELAEAVASGPFANKAVRSWKVDTAQHPTALKTSQDGGRTWKQVTISGFQPKFVLWKHTTVWAIDSQGNIMQSDDNGGHWIRLRHVVHASIP